MKAAAGRRTAAARRAALPGVQRATGVSGVVAAPSAWFLSPRVRYRPPSSPGVALKSSIRPWSPVQPDGDAPLSGIGVQSRLEAPELAAAGAYRCDGLTSDSQARA